MNFTHLVATFGYWVVLVFVAIQCAGIPFPGGAVLLAAAGAILGNLLGYVLGAYYLGESLHRPTGPLGIALTVLVLCFFAFCICLLLRNIRRLEDEAERLFPGPLDLGVVQTKQHTEQEK